MLTDVRVSFQSYPTDKAYFIAKEILATERTYLKDLEVITVVSRFDFLSSPFFLTDLWLLGWKNLEFLLVM